MSVEKYDVIIVGGGLVGLSLGCALAKNGLQVHIIEKQPFVDFEKASYDGRASALSSGSVQVFKGIDLWPYIEKEACPIKDVRIVDGSLSKGISPLFLHYDHQELGQGPLGYIVENRVLRHATQMQAQALENLTISDNTQVVEAHYDGATATVRLTDKRELKAELLVCAQGRFSPLRNQANIPITEKHYNQTAIVCTIKHERAHNGTAVECFLPSGPFAMLPMTHQRSNIVWSEHPEKVKAYNKLDDAAFLKEVSRRFGDWLGKIELVGPRFSYPLSMILSHQYSKGRMVLVGDAAHGIHPVAGQGFNLGIRDIAALSQVLVEAKRNGQDLGNPMVLKEYERWRRFDSLLMAKVCDGLLTLFSNDIPPVRWARDMGLATVQKLPPLKRVFMRHAMGIVGHDVPRLIQGKPL